METGRSAIAVVVGALAALAGVAGCGADIGGAVTAYGSGEPVAGADVTVWDRECDVTWVIVVPVPSGCKDVPKARATTGADGRFHVSGIDHGSYTLAIAKDGYLPYQSDLDASRDVRLDVSLYPVPPAAVTDLASRPTREGLLLTWTNPAAANFGGVLLLRRTGQGISESPLEQARVYEVGERVADWDVVYRGGDASFVDPALPDNEYDYRAYAFSDLSVYNLTPAQLDLSYDGSPPGVPTDLVATQLATGVELTWTAGTDAWDVLVVRTDGAPVVEEPEWGVRYDSGGTFDGGQALIVGIAWREGFFDGSIVPGATYRYTLFAYDEWKNYAPGVWAEITTTDPPPP